MCDFLKQMRKNVPGKVKYIGMSMQQGRNWHLSKFEFSVDLENTGKNTQFKTSK